MKNVCIVAIFISLLAACGSQDKQPQAQAQSLDSVPAEILAKVPKYLIERTNYETGVVEYAYTNEAPLEVDLSTEEGRQAYGKHEAGRFERGTLVTVKTLTGDEDKEMLQSSESFFYGGWGGGLGWGRGLGFGLGGWGFGFGGLGWGGWGGYGFNGYGLGGACFNPCFNPCGGFW